MVDLSQAVGLDLETLPIEDRPRYPPEPVGVAIKWGDEPTTYWAWGHLAGNTCTWGEARAALLAVAASGRPVYFHHAKFDQAVFEERLALPPLPWGRVHDTLPLLYLHDPRAATFALKPSAAALLGRAPAERDAVVEWLLANVVLADGRRPSASPKSPRSAARYVALAPPAVVGPYACGDVDRARDLLLHLLPAVEARGMGAAYDLERELTRVLLGLEREGLRVDLLALECDVPRQRAALVRLEAWLRARLGCGDANLDSSAELADALVAGGAADPAGFDVTTTGQRSTNKASLAAAVRDPQVAAALRHRAALLTCLRTFLEPWLATATASGGRIFTSWHPTRVDRGGSTNGTSTGRLSSTPPFQNFPKQFKPLFDGPGLPPAPVQLPPLPVARAYLLPDVGHVWAVRDASQQELRLLGHFAGGGLAASYRADPWVDLHQLVATTIGTSTGTVVDRGRGKTINFAVVYGVGNAHLAELLGCTYEAAKSLKRTYFQLFPEVKDVYDEMKRRARAREPIRTLGGREYLCEEPQVVAGRLRTFDYKLPNLLIQGSAADHMKRSLRRFARAAAPGWRLRLTVHDEVAVSCPPAELDAAMACLRAALDDEPLDVPMLSEGKTGPSLGALTPYDRAGRRC